MESGATHEMTTISKFSRRLTVQKGKKLSLSIAYELRTVRCIQCCFIVIGRTHLRCELSQKRKIIYNSRTTLIYNNIHTFYIWGTNFFFRCCFNIEQTMNKKWTKQWWKPLGNKGKAWKIPNRREIVKSENILAMNIIEILNIKM